MLRRKLLGARLLAGIASAAARPRPAQATVGADLSLFSGYVWRGISVTNRPVGQPNAYVAFPAGKTTVTVGGWANVDLGRYDETDDFSQSGGVSSFNLAEFDPWAEVSVPVGKATHHRRRRRATYSPTISASTDALNTWEVYGKVGLGVPSARSSRVYYDVDKVKGAYLEGRRRPCGAARARCRWTWARSPGFSAGQAEAEDPEEMNNFVENGFTHLDLSAGVPLTRGHLLDHAGAPLPGERRRGHQAHLSRTKRAT